MQLLTRQEVEKKLEAKYLGKVITFIDIRNNKVAGKVQRIAAEPDGNDLMVIFILDHKRYEADINYFLENTEIHGNSSRTS